MFFVAYIVLNERELKVLEQVFIEKGSLPYGVNSQNWK